VNSIKQKTVSLYKRFRYLILYGIIGTFCAGIDFFIFYTLTTIFEVFYLVSNIISVSVGITISFILNRKYNFKVKDKRIKRFIIFILVGSGGLLLSSALLYFFVDILTLEKVVSKILSIVFIVLIQFLLNKLITFKKEL
jgi:putative flippase GtrA